LCRRRSGPAKFGYKKTDVAWSTGGGGRFLFCVAKEVAGRRVAWVVLRCVRVAGRGEASVCVRWGRRWGADFLRRQLELPPGVRVLLYPNVEHDFAAGRLVGTAAVARLGKWGEVRRVWCAWYRLSGQEAGGVVEWSGIARIAESFPGDSVGQGSGPKPETVRSAAGRGVRGGPLVELQTGASGVGIFISRVEFGLLMAILLSSWLAARVVANRWWRLGGWGAGALAAGDWETRVARWRSRDELGRVWLRRSNRMTGELRDAAGLIWCRRSGVAAWREVWRGRLAHELKNPLFPLQVTVENLVRARGLPEFEEVFEEEYGGH